jgi:hypothetical protein
MRLIRSDATPPSHDVVEDYVFGLQDTKQEVILPERRADGMLVFDFTLRAKPGRDPEHPAFTGRFASGPADDRFVYLSWRSVPRGVWINRVKARLSSISWAMLEGAEAAGQPLVADMSGKGPGDKQKFVTWRVAKV